MVTRKPNPNACVDRTLSAIWVDTMKLESFGDAEQCGQKEKVSS